MIGCRPNLPTADTSVYAPRALPACARARCLQEHESKRELAYCGCGGLVSERRRVPRLDELFQSQKHPQNLRRRNGAFLGVWPRGHFEQKSANKYPIPPHHILDSSTDSKDFIYFLYKKNTISSTKVFLSFCGMVHTREVGGGWGFVCRFVVLFWTQVFARGQGTRTSLWDALAPSQPAPGSHKIGRARLPEHSTQRDGCTGFCGASGELSARHASIQPGDRHRCQRGQSCTLVYTPRGAVAGQLRASAGQSARCGRRCSHSVVSSVGKQG
jgi:hypothetical protein